MPTEWVLNERGTSIWREMEDGTREMRLVTLNRPRSKRQTRTKDKPLCVRCGGLAEHYHHWAPVAVFEDANNWPGSYLCRACHVEWHRTMEG